MIGLPDDKRKYLGKDGLKISILKIGRPPPKKTSASIRSPSPSWPPKRKWGGRESNDFCLCTDQCSENKLFKPNWGAGGKLHTQLLLKGQYVKNKSSAGRKITQNIKNVFVCNLFSFLLWYPPPPILVTGGYAPYFYGSILLRSV